jgi:hypothetical protein
MALCITTLEYNMVLVPITRSYEQNLAVYYFPIVSFQHGPNVQCVWANHQEVLDATLSYFKLHNNYVESPRCFKSDRRKQSICLR